MCVCVCAFFVFYSQRLTFKIGHYRSEASQVATITTEETFDSFNVGNISIGTTTKCTKMFCQYMYLAGTRSSEYLMIIFLLYRYSVWYSWDAVGCKFHRPSWHSFIKFHAMYLVIRRVETTSMEYGSTKYLIQKELFQSKNREGKITDKTWSTKNTLSQAIHICKKNLNKILSTIQIFHTNFYFWKPNARKWAIILDASGSSTAPTVARETGCKAWNSPADYA